MTLHPYALAEGERRKADALLTLAERREVYVNRGRRALLQTLLAVGSANADDVRRLVKLPLEIDAKLFGAVPGPLARAGIIRAAGFLKTCRAVGHARPVTVWTLVDRDKASRWLADHPDRLDPGDGGQDEPKRQACLFDMQETATPTGTAAGAAL